MRALMLGSGGRVGRLLRAAWDHPDVQPIWHNRQSHFDILTHPTALKDAAAEADVIVNFAGVTHHGAQALDDMNVQLARQVLDAAGDTPVFLLSSAAVYGRPTQPLTEDAPLAPASDYGHDKAAMEAMAQGHGARSIILRLGNVAGADALLGIDRDTYILDQFSNGTFPRRSYIGPSVLANVIAQLCLNPKILPPVMNVAAPQAVSMADLLNAADKPWSHRPAPADAIEEVELQTQVLEKHVTMPKDASDPAAIVKDLMLVETLS